MTKFHPSLSLTDMPADQPAVIICVLETVLAHLNCEGDARRACQGCLRTVRVAPSSLSLLAEAERLGRAVRVLCWECAGPLLDKPDTELGLAVGAIDEIISRTGGHD